MDLFVQSIQKFIILHRLSLRWLVLLGFLLMSFLCIFFFFHPPQNEPEYNGKNLAYYLNDLKLFGPVNESPRKLTEEALVAMGIQCLPHLRKRLMAKDSAILPLFTLLDEKFPIGEAPRTIAVPAWIQKKQALRAIPTIGHSAHSLIPELISLLSDSELHYEAAWCLGAIGTKSIDPLVSLLIGRPSDAKVRASAVYALGQLNQKKSIHKAYPVLLQSLDDSSDEVKKQTLIAIRNMRVEEICGDRVRRLTLNENPAVRREAQLTIDLWKSVKSD